MSVKKTICESKSSFILEQDTSGHLFLSVECGTTEVYNISFKLNEAEVVLWQTQGEYFLESLSYQVRDNPDQYLKR
ncbi:MAG: hypothetical protein EAY81_00540 [Bacteroidetes bacterium]|nr:MAG: hypothetical protein EAY81_00540 [Bacteroidota bacterium]TAF32678.1 MAG: hypothetical protein EAZ67_09330 [Cytophagales bacterium]TAF60325.1 MAG: hypothetical protein EAZ57_08255 [Cytophagales bacterium]